MNSVVSQLPKNVIHYKSSPTFTQDTVPPSLTREHNTKEGVWGLLNVENGSLKYVITEEGNESEQVLATGDSAVIKPQQTHYVTPLGEVAFHVAFHK